MNTLLWFLRGILFVVLLGLAIKNSGDVELRFYFDAHWQLPLSIVVLISLATGVVLGLLALLPQILRQRRAVGRLRQQLNQAGERAGTATAPIEAGN